MRKVNLASFLAQSKHAAAWQHDTLDAARPTEEESDVERDRR